MDYANAIVKTAKAFYDAINPATLSGAIDVIVVEQPDGQLKATPFHIRFGKVGVWSLTDKYVDIEINGDDIGLKMKLGATGVVYSNAPDAVPPLIPQLETTQLATNVPTHEPPPPIIAGPESPRLNASTEDGAVYSTSTNEAVKDDAGSTNGLLYSSLRLSSDRLKSLGLKYGANEARFSITTMYQFWGTSWCSCNIHLYKWNEQIVVSDIDGTITKSDVLGHVIPAIGGTWAHTGVADLYTRIIENGYKVVYLSSRAIGQSYMTRQYLKTVIQGSRRLPDGPVLLSPSSVLMAFRLEVIDRKPDEFKIAALKDLKKLFPVEQPFYAGFGNRETDVKSYRAVNIPPTRILIVDPSGHVRGGDSAGFVSSYKSMADTADYLFPPLANNPTKEPEDRQRSGWYQPLEHSTFTHWKAEPTVDLDIEAYEKKRKEERKQKKKS